MSTATRCEACGRVITIPDTAEGECGFDAYAARVLTATNGKYIIVCDGCLTLIQMGNDDQVQPVYEDTISLGRRGGSSR